MAWLTIGFELAGRCAVLLGAWIPVVAVPLALGRWLRNGGADERHVTGIARRRTAPDVTASCTSP
jgi:hypothetical protein